MADLADLAARLRDLHGGGSMLVLPNAWDAQSARIVEEAGFPAVATSSGAVARMLGRADGEEMTPDEAFAGVAAVARSVSIPVSADLEGGYGLDADEFVGRLLEAGAVGCNVEDTDHAGGGTGLVDAAAQADRLAAIKEACRRAGVDVVLNARVDTFARGTEAPLEEALARGRRYLAAGADCIYPITASDEGDIAAMVEALGTINVMQRPGAPSLARLRKLRVARVTFGSGLHRVAMEAFRAALPSR
jgi:2-methylisocitrate lyase-like PEP mutase family enzyme